MSYFKCTALVLVFTPMQFLMFTTTIKGFMASGTPLVGLNVAVSTNELIGSDVTHYFRGLPINVKKYLKIHHNFVEHWDFSEIHKHKLLV